MNLSISIMAHPSRKDNIPYLFERVGVVPVVYDDGSGIWDTCKRAWNLYDPRADFHLVLQDDAIVCENFHNRVQDVLTEGAHSLYFGYRKNYVEDARVALPKGEIILPYLHWGLAVCLPSRLVEPMIAFGDRCDLPSTHDDTRIKRFLQRNKMDVRYPLPSLVDHRADVSIVTGVCNPGRRAMYYIDADNNDLRDETRE